MAKGTGIRNIPRRLVSGGAKAFPINRMGIEYAMTGFTAIPPLTFNADVKTGVGPLAGRLGMAGMTDNQISLGVRTMQRTIKIGAIKGMRRYSRPISVAAEAAITSGARKTTRGHRAAKQVGAVTGGTGGGVRCYPMVNERIGPVSRMNSKGLVNIKVMTGIATGRAFKALQGCAMAGGTGGGVNRSAMVSQWLAPVRRVGC